MGKYINKNSTGVPLPAVGKAKVLIADGAVLIPATPTQLVPGLVCVVNNGPFEAAAYIYSESELKAFNNPQDFRPRVWLAYEHAEKLAM